MNNEELKKIVKIAIKLVEKWQLSDVEKKYVLGFDYQGIPMQISVDQEQRLSLLLNIHNELRQLFSNPDNYYGYMTLTNHNPPFCGRRPIDLVKNLDGLYSVYKSISQIKTYTIK